LRQTGNLELEIVDDGKGIPASVIRGIGLASMQARCEELCGTFQVETGGWGTKIRVRMPLKDPSTPVVPLPDAWRSGS